MARSKSHVEAYAQDAAKAVRAEYGRGWSLLTERQKEAELARRFMLDLMGWPDDYVNAYPEVGRVVARARAFLAEAAK